MNKQDILTKELRRLRSECNNKGAHVNELFDLLNSSICALRFYQSALGEKISKERYRDYEILIDRFNQLS